MFRPFDGRFSYFFLFLSLADAAYMYVCMPHAVFVQIINELWWNLPCANQNTNCARDRHSLSSSIEFFAGLFDATTGESIKMITSNKMVFPFVFCLFCDALKLKIEFVALIMIDTNWIICYFCVRQAKEIEDCVTIRWILQSICYFCCFLVLSDRAEELAKNEKMPQLTTIFGAVLFFLR